jgi:hypothetical protein
MKKVLLAIAVLMISAPQMTRGAQDQGKPVPDWVLQHRQDQAKGIKGKRVKPAKKIGGTAQKGAPQVSPLGKKGKVAPKN